MQSRRSRDRNQSCLRKKTYRTEASASDAIREYEARVVWPRTMTPYQCRHGKHWHKGELRRRIPRAVLLANFMLQQIQSAGRIS